MRQAAAAHTQPHDCRTSTTAHTRPHARRTSRTLAVRPARSPYVPHARRTSHGFQSGGRYAIRALGTEFTAKRMAKASSGRGVPCSGEGEGTRPRSHLIHLRVEEWGGDAGRVACCASSSEKPQLTAIVSAVEKHVVRPPTPCAVTSDLLLVERAEAVTSRYVRPADCRACGSRRRRPAR